MFNQIRLNLKLQKRLLYKVILFLFILMIFQSFLPLYNIQKKSYDIFTNSMLDKSIIYYNDSYSILPIDEITNEDIRKSKDNISKINNLIYKNDNVKYYSPNINSYSFELDRIYNAENTEKPIIDIYKNYLTEKINEEDIDPNSIQMYIFGTENAKHNFKIGKKYTTKIWPTGDNKDNKNDATLQVAGYIDTNYINLIHRGVYTNGSAPIDVFFKNLYVDEDSYEIFFEFNDKLKSIDNVEYMSTYSTFSKFIYFDDKTTTDDIEKFNNDIKSLNIGNSNTSIQLKENQESKNNYFILKYIDRIIISIILIIFALTIFTYVNSNKISKANKVYKLSGAKNWQIILASFISNMVPFLIVFLPYTIYSLFRNSSWYGLIKNETTVNKTTGLLSLRDIGIISILVIIFMFILTLVSNYKIIKTRGNKRLVVN